MLATRLQKLLLAAVFVMGAGEVGAAPPTLAHLFPAGGQRGTTVDVVCTGTFSWPVKVFAPGVEVVVAKESGKLKVTIPKDLAADRVWIRLYNSEGASAAAPFLIGGLKESNEQEPNDNPRTAQKLDNPNVTINGVLAKADDVDCFALDLKAGQTLVASVDANARLGSPMDAIVQVTTPDGHVVAENNDDVGLDPRLAFTAPKSGTYLVRIFAFPATADATIRFSGAANYIYRLTLTIGPFFTHAVPMCTSQAKLGEVEVLGWNIPPKTIVPVVPFGGTKFTGQLEAEARNELRIPADARLGIVVAPNFAGAGRMRLVTHDVVPTIAKADPKNPQRLALNSSVVGWLRKPRQTDVFLTPLKKGQQVVIAAEATTLDLPLEPMLMLADPEGKSVASAVETGATRDALVTHTAAKDGDYRISVSDRFRHGGERCFYRLSVRLEEADFELATDVDALVVAPGKPTELVVKVQRRGAIGPITVEAAGLPPGVTAAPVVSDVKGASAAKVALSFTTTGPAFSGPIQVVGKSSQGRTLERRAHTVSRLGASFETVFLTVTAK